MKYLNFSNKYELTNDQKIELSGDPNNFIDLHTSYIGVKFNGKVKFCGHFI